MNYRWLPIVYGIDINGLKLSYYNINISNTDFKILNLTLSANKFLPRESAMVVRHWDRNSVRSSVTRVLCDKMKEHSAGILIPYQRAITLIF